MARTDLMRKLRYLSQLAMATDGAPSFDMAQAAHASRRGFLKAAGAGALGLAMSESGFAAIQTNARIHIVGGGLAGLSCAYRLKQRGIVATIHEASRRIGGRCSTNRSAFKDQYVEQGGEFIDTNHREIRNLAAELSLVLDDLEQFTPPGSDTLYHFDGAPYAAQDVFNDFLSIRKQLSADIKAAPFPTTWDNFTPRGFELDHMSISDWINAYVPGGISSRFGQLLSIAYITEYGAELAQQSALNLLYLLGYSPKDEFAIFGESDERYHIKGGNDLLVQRLIEEVGTGHLQLEHELKRIVRQTNGSYRLFFKTPNGEAHRDADHVVLALPFAILRTSVDHSQAGFDSRKIFAIQNMPMGQNAKLHVQFDQRYWRDAACDGSTYSDNGYQMCWETTLTQAGPQAVLTHYTGGDMAVAMNSASPRRKAAEFVGLLEQVLPGAQQHARNRELLNYWPGHKWTRGSYGYYSPGNYTAFVGYEGTRQNNCHFCGEHTSIKAQGYLNGAVETGLRCAREIIADLKG